MAILIDLKTAAIFPVNDTGTIIGRGRDADILLDDERASRKHAMIQRAEGEYVIQDLGSVNKIQVNDRKVAASALRNGDRIGIGQVKFLFSECDGHWAQESGNSDDVVDVVRSENENGTLSDSLFGDFSETERLVALENLFRVGDLVWRCQTPETFFDRLLNVIAELIPCSLTAVAIDHPGNKEFHLAAVKGRDDRKTISGTVITRVLTTGKPVLQNDVQGDQDLRSAKSLFAQNIISVLAAPLARDGEISGVLYLDRMSGFSSFSTHDLRFVNAVGLMASNHLKTLRNAPKRRVSEASLAHEMIGESDAVRDVLETIRRIAPTDSNILISGETGTGKELAARAIHWNSRRGEFPFVAVNCASIAKDLAESELFGHVKGAFTGANVDHPGKFKLADRGTLFLDEIGDLPLELQVKLLRALEQKEITPVGGREEPVNVRIVAATNVNLVEAIGLGRFREDLYHRLNVIDIRMPALRERRGDIPALVRSFIKEFCQELKKPEKRISRDALNFLAKSEWPGNVRQLRNAMERAVLLSVDPELVTEDFSFVNDKRKMVNSSDGNSPLEFATLRQMERTHIENVLESCEGNKRKCARILGISRSTLYEKLAEYNIIGVRQ